MMLFRRNNRVKDLTEFAREYAQGRLSRKLNPEEFPEETRELAVHLSAITDMLRKFTQDTQVSAGRVSAAVNQVGEAIEVAVELAQRVRTETAATRQTSQQLTEAAEQAMAQVAEAVSASENITGIAENIYKDSVNTKKAAEQGGAYIGQTSEAMNDIELSSRELAGTISALTESAREIDNFLAIIRGIASQTNLLSLNASIEAARAGEHGRGFSVVAQEIQKLSDASTQAANAANGLLVHIDQGITKAADAVAREQSLVIRGVQSTKEANISLQTIVSASAQVEMQLSEVSSARQTQLAATMQAEERLQQISAMCVSTEEHISVVGRSIDEQEMHLTETRGMGNLLKDVASYLVATTQAITLVDMEGAARKETEAKVARLKQPLERLAQQIGEEEPAEKAQEAKLTAFLANFAELEAIWLNGPAGAFILSLPPAGIANASAREWFQEALQGKFYVSPVYVSAISGQPCITIALPVKAASGTVTGVLGVDIKIA